MFERLYTQCEHCSSHLKDYTISYLYIPVNFTWDKPEPWAKPNTFFCSQECRKIWVKENKERQERSKPYLAELDQSMNYCEYFVRDNGNKGRYVRDWFEYEVNWLWDYKCFNVSHKWSLEFLEAFKKYFNHNNWFDLHHRYK